MEVPVQNAVPIGIPEEDVKECRICKDTDSPEQMIVPCDCTGSMKYTHKLCLIQWIQARNEGPGHTLDTRCRVCKSEYGVAERQKFWSFINQNFYELLPTFLRTLLISLIMIIAILLIRMIVNSYETQLIRQMSKPCRHWFHLCSHVPCSPQRRDFNVIATRNEFHQYRVVLSIVFFLPIVALWAQFAIAIRDEWRRHYVFTIRNRQI